MSALEYDVVVSSIFEKFDALPTKSKPRTLENGGTEWVPLSGIAIVGGVVSMLNVAERRIY